MPPPSASRGSIHSYPHGSLRRIQLVDFACFKGAYHVYYPGPRFNYIACPNASGKSSIMEAIRFGLGEKLQNGKLGGDKILLCNACDPVRPATVRITLHNGTASGLTVESKLDTDGRVSYRIARSFRRDTNLIVYSLLKYPHRRPLCPSSALDMVSSRLISSSDVQHGELRATSNSKFAGLSGCDPVHEDGFVRALLWDEASHDAVIRETRALGVDIRDTTQFLPQRDVAALGSAMSDGAQLLSRVEASLSFGIAGGGSLVALRKAALALFNDYHAKTKRVELLERNVRTLEADHSVVDYRVLHLAKLLKFRVVSALYSAVAAHANSQLVSQTVRRIETVRSRATEAKRVVADKMDDLRTRRSTAARLAQSAEGVAQQRQVECQRTHESLVASVRTFDAAIVRISELESKGDEWASSVANLVAAVPRLAERVLSSLEALRVAVDADASAHEGERAAGGPAGAEALDLYLERVDALRQQLSALGARTAAAADALREARAGMHRSRAELAARERNAKDDADTGADRNVVIEGFSLPYDALVAQFNRDRQRLEMAFDAVGLPYVIDAIAQLGAVSSPRDVFELVQQNVRARGPDAAPPPMAAPLFEHPVVMALDIRMDHDAVAALNPVVRGAMPRFILQSVGGLKVLARLFAAGSSSDHMRMRDILRARRDAAGARNRRLEGTNIVQLGLHGLERLARGAAGGTDERLSGAVPTDDSARERLTFAQTQAGYAGGSLMGALPPNVREILREFGLSFVLDYVVCSAAARGLIFSRTTSRSFLFANRRLSAEDQRTMTTRVAPALFPHVGFSFRVLNPDDTNEAFYFEQRSRQLAVYFQPCSIPDVSADAGVVRRSPIHAIISRPLTCGEMRAAAVQMGYVAAQRDAGQAGHNRDAIKQATSAVAVAEAAHHTATESRTAAAAEEAAVRERYRSLQSEYARTLSTCDRLTEALAAIHNGDRLEIKGIEVGALVPLLASVVPAADGGDRLAAPPRGADGDFARGLRSLRLEAHPRGREPLARRGKDSEDEDRIELTRDAVHVASVLARLPDGWAQRLRSALSAEGHARVGPLTARERARAVSLMVERSTLIRDHTLAMSALREARLAHALAIAGEGGLGGEIARAREVEHDVQTTVATVERHRNEVMHRLRRCTTDSQALQTEFIKAAGTLVSVLGEPSRLGHVRHVEPDGEVRWVSEDGQAFAPPLGNPFGGGIDEVSPALLAELDASVALLRLHQLAVQDEDLQRLGREWRTGAAARPAEAEGGGGDPPGSQGLPAYTQRPPAVPAPPAVVDRIVRRVRKLGSAVSDSSYCISKYAEAAVDAVVDALVSSLRANTVSPSDVTRFVMRRWMGSPVVRGVVMDAVTPIALVQGGGYSGPDAATTDALWGHAPGGDRKVAVLDDGTAVLFSINQHLRNCLRERGTVEDGSREGFDAAAVRQRTAPIRFEQDPDGLPTGWLCEPVVDRLAALSRALSSPDGDAGEAEAGSGILRERVAVADKRAAAQANLQVEQSEAERLQRDHQDTIRRWFVALVKPLAPMQAVFERITRMMGFVGRLELHLDTTPVPDAGARLAPSSGRRQPPSSQVIDVAAAAAALAASPDGAEVPEDLIPPALLTSTPEKLRMAAMVSFQSDGGVVQQSTDVAMLSGGETSLVAMLFILSVQSCIGHPVVCVDEVNQGVDSNYERALLRLLMRSVVEERRIRRLDRARKRTRDGGTAEDEASGDLGSLVRDLARPRQLLYITPKMTTAERALLPWYGASVPRRMKGSDAPYSEYWKSPVRLRDQLIHALDDDGVTEQEYARWMRYSESGVRLMSIFHGEGVDPWPW